MDVTSTTDIQDLIKRCVYTRGVIHAIAGSYYPDIDDLRTESETWTPRSRALVTSLIRCVPRPPLSVCLFVSIIASSPSLLCVLWMTQPPLLSACTLYTVRCTLYVVRHCSLSHRLRHIVTDFDTHEEPRQPGVHITQDLCLDLLVDKDKLCRFILQNRHSYHAGDVGTQITHTDDDTSNHLRVPASVVTLKRRLQDANEMRKRIKAEIHNSRRANKALAVVVAIAALSGGFRRCTCYTCEGQMSENTQKCCTGRHDQCAQNWLYLLFVAVRERRLCVTSCGVDKTCNIPPPDPEHANYTPPDVVANRVRRVVHACRENNEPFEYCGQAVTDEVVEHTLTEYKELYDEWHKNVIEAPIKIAERVQGILTENHSPCCNQSYEFTGSCDVKCARCGCHFCDLCHRLFTNEAAIYFHVPACIKATVDRCGVATPPLDVPIPTETRESLLRERHSQYICRLARTPDYRIVNPPIGVYTWHKMVKKALRGMRIGGQSIFVALGIRSLDFRVVVS